MTAIELDGVSKEFGDVVALDGIDLTVEEGEIFGFLGPNGAGKSTTIDILLDFVRPTEGSATVLGHDARDETVAVRRRTGVLPEGFGIYERLTGRQHVEFALESKGLGGGGLLEQLADADTGDETGGADEDDPVEQRAMELLERVGIAEAADRRAGDYSKGMQQRLALAMALAGDPDLLILDEPSTGLDPNGAREMREIVREERDRGATVFFSSHILGQVEAVCDRVGILREGEVVAVDSVEGLREAADAESTLTIDVDTIPDGLVSRLREIGGVTRVDSEGTTLTVGCGDDAKTAILNAVEEEASVENFSTDEASLEELFAAYTTGDEAVGADEDGRETGDDTDDAAESGVAETDTTRTEEDVSEDGDSGAEKSEADDTAADEEVER